MSSVSSVGEVVAQAKQEEPEKGKEKVDEQIEVTKGTVELTAKPSMELTDPAILEVRDPAILEVREQRRITYTRETLLKLRDSPFSILQPANVDISSWSFSKKRAETPGENIGNSRSVGGGSDAQLENNNIHKRRAGGGDPKERLRKEQDRIVLSPQRESFNHGCFVPAGRESSRTTTNNRSHSPLGGGKSEGTHGGNAGGSRRIGSGRIIRDPWDYPDKNDEFRSGFRRDTGEERYERRSFGRDFEVNREKEKERHIGRSNGGRYNDRRRISSDSKEEEPEWFSGGPVSQTDTIELRGFEEGDRATSGGGGGGAGKKKQSPAQKKRAAAKERKASNSETTQPTLKKTEEDVEGEKREEKANGCEKRESETVKDVGGGGDGAVVETEKAKEKEPMAPSLEFFFNEAISGLLTNGVGGDGDASSVASSRFTQFFKREKSPPPQMKQTDSRRSSLQDNTIIRNVLKDIEEPSVAIPPAGDSNSYFAPISPAANTMQPGGGVSKPISDLVEMLQRGGNRGDGMMKSGGGSMGVPGKLMHLEEIEANMRQQGGGDVSQKMAQQQKSEEDLTAFRRLLAQIQLNSSNGTIPQKTQPMTLMEMLSHSQQQDEVRMAAAAAAAAHHMLSPNHHPLHHQQQQQQQHELAIKLQHMQNQVQQRNVEMLSKMMTVSGLQASVAAAAATARQQLRTSPLPTVLPDMGVQQSRELLNRPEAQAILQGLQRGDITPQHLHQQLAANPAMQPRHRELLYAILKLQQQQQQQQRVGGGSGGGGVGPSPRVLSPVPPLLQQTQQQQQQQQQLRVSPLPPTAMHQRIPSPRELQVHTQNILQRALIKKKLEEQQENFRKKQELQLQQQRGQSPNNNNNNSATVVVNANKSVSSPTPLAFTPTSVLRKMTADNKEEGRDGGGKDLMKGLGQQQGRAVTGIRPPQVQQQQNPMQQQWNTQYNIKQTGRPILKSNSNYQQPVPQNQQEQQYYQQQQQRLFNQQQQRQKQFGNPAVAAPQPQLPSSGQYSAHPQYNSSNQYNQLTQQQMRAQHQQHVRSQQQPLQQQQQQQQQQQRNWLQMLNQSQPQNYDDRNSTSSTPSHQGSKTTENNTNNSGDLSPTSNQLARWFSPTLLEKARAGKLPNMPSTGLTPHALSLEEIERQTTAPVHN